MKDNQKNGSPHCQCSILFSCFHEYHRTQMMASSSTCHNMTSLEWLILQRGTAMVHISSCAIFHIMIIKFVHARKIILHWTVTLFSGVMTTLFGMTAGRAQKIPLTRTIVSEGVFRMWTSAGICRFPSYLNLKIIGVLYISIYIISVPCWHLFSLRDSTRNMPQRN